MSTSVTLKLNQSCRREADRHLPSNILSNTKTYGNRLSEVHPRNIAHSQKKQRLKA